MSDCPMLLLAGGFGTRLSSVISDLPKPLAPVNHEPFLNYIIRSYKQQGVNEFIFLIHHMADKMRSYIDIESKSGLLRDVHVEVVEENNPLGTGGSIKNAVIQLKLNSSFLVSNADTYLSDGVVDLMSAGCPSIGAVKVDDVGRYGSLEVENMLIKKFVEKGEYSGPGLINSGLYYLHPSNFMGVDAHEFSIERVVFPELVTKGELRAVKINSEFIDIGVPEDYLKFKNKYEE